MLLFRSEEHLQRWLDAKGMNRGGTMDLETQWALARRWYSDRMDRNWKRFTPQEAQEIFTGFGLTGSFWQLS